MLIPFLKTDLQVPVCQDTTTVSIQKDLVEWQMTGERSVESNIASMFTTFFYLNNTQLIKAQNEMVNECTIIWMDVGTSN